VFPLLGLITTAVLVVLATLARLLADLRRRNRRAVARERVLARAGADLLQAADPAALQRTAVGAARELLGPAEAVRVRLVDTDGGEPEAADGDGEAPLLPPLPAPDGSGRAVLVTGRRPVPAEARDALDSLGAQVTLALDRAALTAELTRRTGVDPLTGLANRAWFHRRLEEAVAGAAADGAGGALLLDLDDFRTRTVNDGLGHLGGDRVLVALAERLRARLHEGDTAARLGGDEFAVLLHRVGGEREALAVAERLAADLRQPVEVAGRQVHARASVGGRPPAAATPTSCCATPTWRCTPPSGPDPAPCGCSTRGCTTGRWSGWTSRRCAGRCWSSSSPSATSR
jgi:diguanylate cyclase (GGDEF)-like protein